MHVDFKRLKRQHRISGKYIRKFGKALDRNHTNVMEAINGGK